jgi:hypothetical protein
VIAALVVVACGPREPRPLEQVIADGDLGSWRVDEAAWKRIVVEPYREVFAEYDAAFSSHAHALSQKLAKPAARIEVRRHYAGDPKLTTGEEWTRWALPVLAESYVATIDGEPLDIVFVRDGDRWRALSAIDRLVRSRVAALDPSCPIGGASKPCRELAWQIADAALRTQPSRFTRACALAAAHCGKPAP